MLRTEFTGQFKKDYKLAIKRGCDPEELKTVLDTLINEKPLDKKYCDHPLTDLRLYKGMRECHIQPDWLLVYQVIKKTLILRLIRTGTHSDLY